MVPGFQGCWRSRGQKIYPGVAPFTGNRSGVFRQNLGAHPHGVTCGPPSPPSRRLDRWTGTTVTMLYIIPHGGPRLHGVCFNFVVFAGRCGQLHVAQVYISLPPSPSQLMNNSYLKTPPRSCQAKSDSSTGPSGTTKRTSSENASRLDRAHSANDTTVAAEQCRKETRLNTFAHPGPNPETRSTMPEGGVAQGTRARRQISTR